ncbi:response regulator transcription factor [Candidatus Contubernalis alkaliaceticus]|uniref:response regulator transcription factor n=1 Tax=Candidatus Contubernalis alkaliaceticus TaxID=338645 RepID=UPI001F4C446C|nr:response regulator transcription factor [Candidatus Contubernalis alkalaceticus]UNC91992.1 response regulator transcription factor [Candidatus Contubernalis alkalaceticus]
MNIKLLIVEDDIFLQDGLCQLLRQEGYSLHCAGTCTEALRLVEENTYSLIILDIMLPDGSGLDLCTAWRSTGKDTPILFLTARDDEIQIVRGLDAGGDDYVTKPFRLLELLSRVRALLRRNNFLVYNKDGLRVDLQKMSVYYKDEPLFLTPTEFQLLSALIRNAGKVLTRRILLQTIWDDGGLFIDDNTLSVHISRLREKIGGTHIQTVRGIGYRWEDKQ